MNSRSLRLGALLCVSMSSFSAPASAELIYGIAAVGNATALVTWDSATPGTLASGTFVSGLQPNETLAGIDFRPATGQLYGLGTSSRLYTINPATGVVTNVGISPFSPNLNGFNFGFDFDPRNDRIHVVAETNKNYIVNPNNGGVQTVATDVNYSDPDVNKSKDPNVTQFAYSNNRPGFTFPNPLLYGIDSGLDILVEQNNSIGSLKTIGPLGVDVGAVGGFDIATTATPAIGVDHAYAALLPAGSSTSRFYSINLLTGAATDLGQIDGGLIITALAAVPAAIPEPATVALAGLGLLGCVVLRRKMS
jgi:hypothetical protein